MYFSELKNYDDPEVIFEQAKLYSKFNVLMNLQVKYLLKLLTLEEYSNYPPSFVFDALIRYFMSVKGVDVAQYYADILGKIFKNKIDIRLIKAPKNVLAETRFRVLDGGEDVVAKHFRDSIMVSSMENTSEKSQGESGGFDSAKDVRGNRIVPLVVQCYDMIERGEVDLAQKYAEQMGRSKNDPEAVIIFYKIAITDEKYRAQNFEYILAFKNKTNNSLVDMVKTEVLLHQERSEECLEFISQIAEKNFNNYITFFSFSKVRCFVKLGRIDEAIEELKFLIAINPKDFNNRIVLKKIISWKESGKAVDENCLLNPDLREVYEELIDLISLSDEEFMKINTIELSSSLTYLTCVSSIEVIRMVVEKIIRTKTNLNFLLDFLIDPEVYEDFKFSLIRILLENGYESKIYYLSSNKLKSFVPKYPQKLYADINFAEEFTDSSSELVSCFIKEYALASLRVLKKGKDLDGFSKFVDSILGKLMCFQADEIELVKKEGVISALMLELYSQKEKVQFSTFVPKRILEDFEKVKKIYQDNLE